MPRSPKPAETAKAPAEADLASPSPVRPANAAEASPAPACTYVALMKIHAGGGRTYCAGDAIPEAVAMDGLSEHIHWSRE